MSSEANKAFSELLKGQREIHEKLDRNYGKLESIEARLDTVEDAVLDVADTLKGKGVNTKGKAIAQIRKSRTAQAV
jgi:uncharacterized protein (UPF0335 family)